MSCNWCQDKEVARGLIVQLCKKDNDTWKDESNLDLCYCTPCVREYHRLKEEYIKEKPACEKILYQIEVERLRNHFLGALSQQDSQSEIDGSSEFPYDIEDYLKVPLLEMLQYPYLLFNSELMSLFVSCLVLLIDSDKFSDLEEKLPGLYLLLINPCLKVRKWALKITKDLGTITMEDFDVLSPVINCMLKVVLYGLLENREGSETWPIPMSTVDDETNPLPHLYYPLSRKDLWIGIGAFFNALEESALRLLFSRKGHCQLLEIWKDTLEMKNPDSEGAFWPLLFCLKMLMQKLEATFWLLTNFDDAPKTTFRLILSHPVHKSYLKKLAVRTINKNEDANVDEYSADEELSLSQLAEKCDNEESNLKMQHQPFFWILPYIVTVLDLEYLAEKITSDVMRYLVSLVMPSDSFWQSTLPTELDLAVLNCLCNLIKYLLDRKLICLVKRVSIDWLEIVRQIRFSRPDMATGSQSKRWSRIVKKSHSILTAILSQAKNCDQISLDEEISKYSEWLRLQKLGQSSESAKVGELMQFLLDVLTELTEIGHSSLTAFNVDQDANRLFSFSSQDDDQYDIMESAIVSKDNTEDESHSEQQEPIDDPIYIVSSDEESDHNDLGSKGNESTDQQSLDHESTDHQSLDQRTSVHLSSDHQSLDEELLSPTKSFIEPISYEEDLDYAEDEEMDMNEPDTNSVFARSIFSSPSLQSKAKNQRDKVNNGVKSLKPNETAKKTNFSLFEGRSPIDSERNIQRKSSAVMKQSLEVSPTCIVVSDSDSDSSFLTREKPPVLFKYGKESHNQSRELSVEKSHTEKFGRRMDQSSNDSDSDKNEPTVVVKRESDGICCREPDKETPSVSIIKKENRGKHQKHGPGKTMSIDNMEAVRRKSTDDHDELTYTGSVEVVDSSDMHILFQSKRNKLTETKTGVSLPEQEYPHIKKEILDPSESFGNLVRVSTQATAEVKYEKAALQIGSMDNDCRMSPEHEGSELQERTKKLLLQGRNADKDSERSSVPPVQNRSNVNEQDMSNMDRDRKIVELSVKTVDVVTPSSNHGRITQRSPLERRGVFDFLSEIKQNDGTNDAVNKNCDIVEETSQSRNKENVSAMETDDTHDGVDEEFDVEGKEREVNLSSEKFQRRKHILYDQFVKKKELKAQLDRESVDPATNVGVAAKTHEKDPEVPKDQAMTDKPEQKVQQEHLPEVRKHKYYSHDSLLKFILAWHPVWMENEQEDELSITLPYEPQMVNHKYNSFDEYMTTMWPLVLIEFFAQMIRDYKERDKQVLDYRFESFEPVNDGQQFRIVNCKSLQEYDANVGNQVKEYDLVIMRGGDEHIIEAFGVIEGVEKTPLRDEFEDEKGSYSFMLVNLKIKVANLHPGIKLSSVQVEVVTSLVTLHRRWEALLRIPKSLLAADILNPFRKQVFEVPPDKNGNNASLNRLQVKYNPGQATSIAKITDAVVAAYPLPKLRLLQGPPGTGKTYTLQGLIKSTLQALSKKENCRILICAPSNAAVDEIASRLIQDPPRLHPNKKDKNAQRQPKKPARTNCGDFNLIRFGEMRQVKPSVQGYTLESLVEQELKKLKICSDPMAIKGQLHKMVQRLKELDKECTKLKMSGDKRKHHELKKKMAEREREQRHYEEMQKKSKTAGQRRDLREEEKRLRTYLLTNAHIICCTVSGAGHKHMINTFRNEWNIRNWPPFACVIIDEAGQCCEPDALIPLQYGSSKLVLVGDPAQLPATILSKRALRYGYGQSLFERIQGALLEHIESPVLVLKEQYRMHPGICAFPSQKFYNGNLITAREVIQRKLLAGIKPFAVLNIHQSQETKEQEGAIHNPEERKYVKHICKEIIHKGITTQKQIGVITPYRKQLQKLRAEMSEGAEAQIEINTIDGFQGREKDIIILSCVRAQNIKKTGIGFLQDPQRMNVALTRAKHSLIVLVHSESLQVDEDWKELIKFARSRSLLYDVASLNEIESAVFSCPEDSLHITELPQKSPSGENVETPSDATTTPLQYEDLSDDEGQQRRFLQSKHGGEKDQNREGDTSATPKLISTEKKSGQRSVLTPQTSIEYASSEGDKQKSKRLELDPILIKRYSKLPHTHSDGRECVEKCFKLEEAKINSAKEMSSPNEGTSPGAYLNHNHMIRRTRFPHKHSDGTRCVNRCQKTGERSKPSSAYYKLPHQHSDGTNCVTKCLRLEEREKNRIRKEQSAQSPGEENVNSYKKQEGMRGAENPVKNVRTDDLTVVTDGHLSKSVSPSDSMSPVKICDSNLVAGENMKNLVPHEMPSREILACEGGFQLPLKNIKKTAAKLPKIEISTSKKMNDENENEPPLPPEETSDNLTPPLPPTPSETDDARPPLPTNDTENEQLNLGIKIKSEPPIENDVFSEKFDYEDAVLKVKAALYARSNAAREAQMQFSQEQGLAFYQGNPPQWQYSANQNDTSYGQTVYQQNMQSMQDIQPNQIIYDLHVIQNIQSNQNMQNIQEMQIMENAQNIPNMQDLHAIQNSQNIQNVQNMQFTQNMQGIENAQNVPNMQDLHAIQNSQNIQNVQNMQFTQNMQGIENVQNVPNMQDLHSIQSSQNIQNMQNIQCTQNMQGIENAQNIPNIQGVQTVPNIQNMQNLQGPYGMQENVQIQQNKDYNQYCGYQAIQENGKTGFHADHGQATYGNEVPVYHGQDESHHSHYVANDRSRYIESSLNTQTINDEIHRIRLSTKSTRLQKDDNDFVTVAVRSKGVGNDLNRTEVKRLGFVHPERQSAIDTLPSKSSPVASVRAEMKQLPEGFFGSSERAESSVPFDDTDVQRSFASENIFKDGSLHHRKRMHSVEGPKRHVVDGIHTSPISNKRRRKTLQRKVSEPSGYRRETIIDLEDDDTEGDARGDFIKDHSRECFPSLLNSSGLDTKSKFKLRDFRVSVQRTNSFENLTNAKGVTEISPQKVKRIVSSIDSAKDFQPHMSEVKKITQGIKERNASRFRKTQLVEGQEINRGCRFTQPKRNSSNMGRGRGRGRN